MAEELEKLREYLRVKNPSPFAMEAIVNDIVIKNLKDRDILIKLCLRTGLLQSFLQEPNHDTLFLNKCKRLLVNDYFVNEDATERAIFLCSYLTIFEPPYSSTHYRDNDIQREKHPSITQVNLPIIEMISIKGGVLFMGSPTSEIGRFDNEELKMISLNSFSISKYAITFEQFDLFCDATGHEKPDDEGWGRSNNPVINVSWDDAVAFAKWVECKLPTESEWEYACRSGSKTAFSTGNNITTWQANYNGHFPLNDNLKGIKRGKTVHVGSFPPNAWGLFEMHGNVFEWCSDSYNGSTDFQNQNTNFMRICRGGSWKSTALECRSAQRGFLFQGQKSCDLGFRIVSLD
jgi:formylglycine-generating enzyme required for sulfatase activity